MATEGETPTPTLDELLDQERRLVLPSLDENGAVAIGLSILNVAMERNLPVTIEVRLRDRVVFRAARNGTDATNDQSSNQDQDDGSGFPDPFSRQSPGERHGRIERGVHEASDQYAASAQIDPGEQH